MPYNQALYDTLVEECSTPRFLPEFRAIFSKFLGVTGFQHPQELISFMHSRDEDAIREKNTVLRRLIDQVQRNTSSQWQSLLLATMLPGLENLFICRRHSHANETHDLWDAIILCFLEAASAIHHANVKDGLVFRVLLDTRHLLGRWEFTRRGYRSRVVLSGEALDPDLPDSAPSPSTDDVTDFLQRLVRREVITDPEAELFIITEIEGFTLRELAKDRNESEVALRQRKSRAMARIRRFLTAEKKNLK
jgi:hypothetical protein